MERTKLQILHLDRLDEVVSFSNPTTRPVGLPIPSGLKMASEKSRFWHTEQIPYGHLNFGTNLATAFDLAGDLLRFLSGGHQT
jgi:hypothetical protein